MANIFLVISLICGVLGFAHIGGPVIGGLAKAASATFFIAFYIHRVFVRGLA